MAIRLALALACLGIPSARAQPVDEVTLVQTGLQIHRRHHEALLAGRAGIAEQVVAGLERVVSGPATEEAFNCTQYPDFCRAPFNCQDAVSPGPLGIATVATIKTKNDHANFQTWCSAPQYSDYMTTCIQKRDLRKAGRIQYQWSVDKGEGITELDGSYCFMEGHCTNTAVTDNTTVEEAEKMCDARYGHDGWAHWNVMSEMASMKSLISRGSSVMSPETGFHDERITKVFLKLACVMGNYHCDVMYCKETYCQKEYFVKKYKHLLPKTPGHLIRQV